MYVFCIMWSVVQTILLSIFIIVIIHHSFIYLKDTLTPRKTKDVIGFQKQKFEEIINELQLAKNAISEPDMESELLDFANEQLIQMT